MASFHQRRLEYEVREYGGAGGYQKLGGYGGGGYGGGGYSGGFGGSGYSTESSGFGSYGGGGGSFGGSGTGYSSGGLGSYGGPGAGGGFGSSGGFESSGADYSSGGFGSSGGFESSGADYSCGYGGVVKAGMYKNEVPPMRPTGGVYPGGSAGGLGDPFCALVPSSFPPGTDPKFIECFNRIDKDRNGLICDQELMAALSSFDQRFSLRTVHLLMYMFTGSNSKVVGPKEFVPLVRSLQTWKAAFQKHDCDRNGRLDERELKEALMSMGFVVSPFVIKLLMSKYDKSGYKCAIEYDYFIECCVVVKGLTEKFRVKEDPHACGTARFTYDEFLLSVLPFIVA